MLFQVVLPAVSGLSSTETYILLAVLGGGLLFLIFKLSRSFVHLVTAIIANTVLGFIALFILNSILKFNIPINLPIVAITALFGLPGIGAVAILKLTGTVIMAII